MVETDENSHLPVMLCGCDGGYERSIQRSAQAHYGVAPPKRSRRNFINQILSIDQARSPLVFSSLALLPSDQSPYSLKKSFPAHLGTHICPICKFLYLCHWFCAFPLAISHWVLGCALILFAGNCTAFRHFAPSIQRLSSLACFPPQICSRRLNFSAEARRTPSNLALLSYHHNNWRAITAYILRYQSIRTPLTHCNAAGCRSTVPYLPFLQRC